MRNRFVKDLFKENDKDSTIAKGFIKLESKDHSNNNLSNDDINSSDDQQNFLIENTNYSSEEIQKYLENFKINFLGDKSERLQESSYHSKKFKNLDDLDYSKNSVQSEQLYAATIEMLKSKSQLKKPQQPRLLEKETNWSLSFFGKTICGCTKTEKSKYEVEDEVNSSSFDLI
ncbi:MAG: hypothetical protein H0U70_02645 [Tatlockia sp.]|nr:hypothetical protein [Tatlockia sp.]